MYLNHIQERFQVSTFGGIPVEFGSMDKKNLDFTTNNSKTKCTKSPKTMKYTINMILPPTKMIQLYGGNKF